MYLETFCEKDSRCASTNSVCTLVGIVCQLNMSILRHSKFTAETGLSYFFSWYYRMESPKQQYIKTKSLLCIPCALCYCALIARRTVHGKLSRPANVKRIELRSCMCLRILGRMQTRSKFWECNDGWNEEESQPRAHNWRIEINSSLISWLYILSYYQIDTMESMAVFKFNQFLFRIPET